MVFAFSACQKSAVENSNNLPLPQSSPTLTPSYDSPIRKIDFENFTYFWTKGLSTKDEKTFTLKNGELPYEKERIGVSLAKVEYGDLTNDSKDEAIINLGLQTSGSAMPNMVCIYALENEKPKLLWSFDTGDRAEGGLKKVYAENGGLIVELFGDDKFENGEWKFDLPKKDAGGLCCPTAFTKLRFKWNGKKFVVDGKPELFNYDWRKEMNKQ